MMHMLHIVSKYVREHLFDGYFGLELESLRVLGNARLSHTLHPFPDDPHVVKDFSESQTEINTGVHESAQGALEELKGHERRIVERLQQLPEREYLWMFSNPPYIRDEDDVRVAVFTGEDAYRGTYREYLSGKYGRYKMTFSGIHVNYSFSEELLRADYEYECAAEGGSEILTYREYKDRLYMDLAQSLAMNGWILVAVTAASPVLDSSFVEKGAFGRDVFSGMGSVRCSELGYWNVFPPVFDYSSLSSYADSMRSYVEKGLLQAPSELYYPIRLKPAGKNNLDSLVENGVNHIELRMFDLNPLTEAGADLRDLQFAQLLILWLACRPQELLTEKDQVKAVQNFKAAAHYDLKTVKIVTPDCRDYYVADEARKLIQSMREFYHAVGGGSGADEVLDFEDAKFVDGDNRYAWKVRREYGEHYVEKAMELAKERQDFKNLSQS